MMTTMNLGSLFLILVMGDLGGRLTWERGQGVASGAGCLKSAGGVASVAGTGGAGGTGGEGGAGGGLPTTPELSIESVVSVGSGCPEEGSVSVEIDSERGAVVLTYPPMTLNASPESGFQSVNCATGLVLLGVPGWQLTAVGASASGEANLPAGTEGEESTVVSFAGQESIGSTKKHLIGPIHGPYDATDTFPTDPAVQSPCGVDTILNINVNLTLQTPGNGPQDASIRVDRVEVPLTWQKC